jgi:uncharacterized membrane protein YhaH (DUF805 family)
MMNPEPTPERTPRFGVFRNWLSLTGLVIVLGSLFAFVLLFLIDSFARVSNPYVGILTFLVAPIFTILGTLLILFGLLWRRWRDGKRSGEAILPKFQIDLGRSRDRRILGFFLTGTALFLLVTAVLSYHSYHYTESTQFCGQACHTVMEPEFVTYSHGPHARVAAWLAPNVTSGRAPPGMCARNFREAISFTRRRWTNSRARFPPRSRTCARPRKPANNVTGQRNLSAILTAPTTTSSPTKRTRRSPCD